MHYGEAGTGATQCRMGGSPGYTRTRAGAPWEHRETLGLGGVAESSGGASTGDGSTAPVPDAAGAMSVIKALCTTSCTADDQSDAYDQPVAATLSPKPALRISHIWDS